MVRHPLPARAWHFRFARGVRYRDDKRPDEVDTIDAVRAFLPPERQARTRVLGVADRDTSFEHYLGYRNFAASTRQQYTVKLRQFGEWCESEGVDVVKATTTDISRFLNHLLEAGGSKGSQRPWYGCLNGYYRWLVDSSVLDRNPMPRSLPRSGPRNTPAPSVKLPDLRRMLDVTVEDQSWAIIALLAFYSVKPGEILACDVSDLHIDSDGATLHFRPMEGAGRRPYLILFPELTERLVRLTAGRRRNDPLFVSNKGNRMGRGSVQGFINTASRRANLGYFATAKMLEYTLPATAISQGFSFVGLLRAVGIIQPRQFVRWLATSAAVPGETNASLRMARLVLSPPDDFENWLLHIDAQLNETDLPEPFAVMAAGAVFERYLRASVSG